MDQNVISVNENTTVREIFVLIRHYKISDFPVVDESGNLTGMVYEQDLLQALYPSIKDLHAGLPDITDLETSAAHALDKKISEIMTEPFVIAREDDKLPKIGGFMLATKTAKVPVLRDKKLVGMVSQSDIFSATVAYAIKSDWYQELLKRDISIPPSVYEGAEKRLYWRMPIKMPIAYKVLSIEGKEIPSPKGVLAETVNISAGGLLIRTTQDLPRNTMLALVFELKGQSEPFRRLCRVVRRRDLGGTFEVGLMFLAMSAFERRKLDDYLEHC